MRGPAPGRDQYSVETCVRFGLPGVSLQEGPGCRDDAGLLAQADRGSRRVECGAAFNLDEHQCAPPMNNQVNLALRAPKTLCDQSVALEAKECQREPLGPPSGGFRL